VRALFRDPRGCVVHPLAGPDPSRAGARIWIPLPYAALYYLIPGSVMRSPARFASLFVLSMSVLAVFGYERLRHPMETSRRLALAAAGRSSWRSLPRGRRPFL